MVDKQSKSFSIESNDLTIEDIFHEFYMVPDYQREYVWTREHVDKLLFDVYDEFYDEQGRLMQGPEYFLGSLVVCKNNSGIYHLIDGQQRMTTIYLLLCCARDLLIQCGATPPNWLNTQIKFVSADPITGDDIERARLTLQYDDSDGILEKIVLADEPVSQLPQKTESVKKIISAYNTIKEFFRINLGHEPNTIKQFVVSFTKRIKLIRIETPTITNALKVFETINDRGIGLTSMDLLKNLLFMKTPQDKYPTLKIKWKGLVDILDQANEKPLRFLRYFIMSHYKIDQTKGLREDQIYDWFVINADKSGINTDPILFCDGLIECAKAYANFINSKDVYGQDNYYLQNLTHLSGALRQHFILLLAARHLLPELFNKLSSAIEDLIFCYIVTRETTKTFERNFARWSEDLRNTNDEVELNHFIDKYITKDILGRVNSFKFAFQELTFENIQQYRIKYILAKLTQHVEELAWNNPTHRNLGMYIASTVEIEHILPQTSNEMLLSEFDNPNEYDEYKIKLGNLTLLEKTLNSSINNEVFSKKVVAYEKSAFLLTKSIAIDPGFGANTQLNRAVKDLKQFDDWTSDCIIIRQEMLTNLALRVWHIPTIS